MIIGLTGGIATGKSTVSKMIMERGIPVVDADIIARQVVEPGTNGFKQIVQAFGEIVLTEEHTLDRKQLGKLIFNDTNKRKVLNNILHPEIRMEMRRQSDEYLKAGHKTVVLDIPLLIESNLKYMADKILLVYVPQEIQIERLMKRDQSTKEEAMSRINSQMPIDEKKEVADDIIFNDGAIAETEEQLDNILKRWKVE
ncbi:MULTISPECIES: dephospho-CoA kinase [Bacillaceae]|uniref:Dephospho-CoA kinase n=1 Tax=Evansella alkalicola TaxID=745819 RepID=A0ABS6JSV4_9BACI|nr:MULTISPECIES: dephospho-CoA kinase [Bacillaceae]MBU9721156.1 dephospho-CoA kinase [Bacillus alkalicola]